MKIAYFDCFSGAAGDMIVGACLDAGVSASALRAELSKLGLDEEFELRIEKTVKKGISATIFHPEIKAHSHGEEHPNKEPSHLPHGQGRGLPDIKKIILHAGFKEAVQNKAIRIFERLAEAEAAVHGTNVESIHFHEVGAVDAILDIVGTCACLDLLGIEKVFCSPLTVGGGTVRCAHGVLPVPAPATAELIRGIPIRANEVPMELLTPTGAAILTTLAEGFGPLPSLRIRQMGYGAGQRDNPELPNVLRVLVGETGDRAAEEFDEVCVLETNLDDTTGEVIGHTTEQLLAAGALDVYTTAIMMKKNRPGTLLTIICQGQDYEKMQDIVFRETTTFGIRRHMCLRRKLQRVQETVDTAYGPIRVKIGRRGKEVYCRSPEFDDCQKAAVRHNVSLKAVMNAAQQAYQDQTGNIPDRE